MTRFRFVKGIAKASFAVLASAVFAGAAFAQGVTITGTVKSEQGQPLNQANVYIAELAISVAANEQGVYRLSIPAERVRGQVAMLRARAIGFVPQNRQITLTAGNMTQNFELKVDINRLSEVVVTGVTGATETKKLTFTVDKVDQASLSVPSASALTQLQGKITGAAIVLPSGRPGVSPSIMLRGVRSINRPLSPLIVVDGVLTQGNMADIDPNDIESIEVVKGAAAASTFGSNAQNGVIQITTRSGKNASQGARFNVRSEFGFQDVGTEYPYAKYHGVSMDETNHRFCAVVSGFPACSRVVDLAEEAYRVNNVADPYALVPYVFTNDYGIAAGASKIYLKGLFQSNPFPVRYNPIAQATTSSPYNDTHLDMTARFGQTGVFASLGNLYQEGPLKYLNGFRRNTARLNLDQAAGEDVNLQISSLYSKSRIYPSNSTFRLTRAPAGVSLLRRDSFGRLFIRSNPLGQGSQNENFLYTNWRTQNPEDADRYLASGNGRYTPFSWLDFQSVVSFDKRRANNYGYTEKGTRATDATSTTPRGSVSHGSEMTQAYNLNLSGTARAENPLGIRELSLRFNSAYSFERRDDESLSTGTFNTLAVPGVLNIRNGQVAGSPSSSITSSRSMGFLQGVAVDFKGRYLMDGSIRRDGSSLFGAAQRWHNYYRGSVAWRLSDEPWWFFKGAANDLKLRAAVGTAGGRPGQTYQYEAFTLNAGGTLASVSQLGNKNLKPENTVETEYGLDAELFSKYGLTITYARSITEDQMLQVPVSSASGFSNQWRNAGQLDSKTWEASLNIPIMTNRNVVWTSRIGYDRNRSYITALDVAPFNRTDGNGNTQFRFQVGERIGQMWAKHILTACEQLPAEYQGQCGVAGSGKEYQINSDGFLVWTGGYSPSEGITQNLWQASKNGCQKAGVSFPQTGIKNCLANGGTVVAPWGQNTLHWGMLMTARDSAGAEVFLPSGNTQPDFHLSLSQNFQYKKLTLYALLDGNYGQRLFNAEVHWSLGDYNVRFEDQDGKTVENAKPIGYYWRATTPENGNGVGGMYNVLGGNNVTIMKGTYTKLREASIAYALGPVRGIGDWSVTLVGRNLLTITDFLGWDPEVGGNFNNTDAIGGSAGFQYPQSRTFTLTLSTRF